MRFPSKGLLQVLRFVTDCGELLAARRVRLEEVTAGAAQFFDARFVFL